MAHPAFRCARPRAASITAAISSSVCSAPCISAALAGFCKGDGRAAAAGCGGPSMILMVPRSRPAFGSLKRCAPAGPIEPARWNAPARRVQCARQGQGVARDGTTGSVARASIRRSARQGGHIGRQGKCSVTCWHNTKPGGGATLSVGANERAMPSITVTPS